MFWLLHASGGFLLVNEWLFPAEMRGEKNDGNLVKGRGAGLQEAHLEVAQLALPLFLRRSSALLAALVATDAEQQKAETPQAVVQSLGSHAPGATAPAFAPELPAADVSRGSPDAPVRPARRMHVQEPLAAAASARAGRDAAARAQGADSAAAEAAADAIGAVVRPMVEGPGGPEAVVEGTAPAEGGEAGGKAGGMESPALPGPDLELLEGLAVVVLQRLAELRVAPEVVDGAIPAAADLRMMVERARRARAPAGSTAPAEAGEQTHVFVVYGAVAECATVRSRAVRAAAVAVLRTVAGLLPMGLGLLGSS